MAESFYIYTLDDLGITDPAFVFTGGPATVQPGATGDILNMDDDDPLLDTLTTGDASQVLTSDLTVDGVVVGSAGDTVSIGAEASAFDLSTFSGGKLVAIIVNGNPVGFASTVELSPGDALLIGPTDFTPGATDYASLVACFTRDTLILCEQGEVAIQDLSVGDLVRTRDNGLQPIRWIGSQKVDGTKQAPVRFKAGSVGNQTDLLVSPMHRMLISGPRAELLFGQGQVLAHAKDLCDGDMVFSEPVESVEYFHVMFDDHQIISAHGCWSESFAATKPALDTLDAKTRDELLEMFPQLGQNWQDVLPTLAGHEAALLSGRQGG